MADQQPAETVASRSFDFTVEEKKTVNATLSLKRYPLKLRSAFGTSHSSTTLRHNALFVVSIDSRVLSYGEVGLPPKKPLCYLADFDDIKNYFVAFLECISSVLLASEHGKYDPFSHLPEKYFSSARQKDIHEESSILVIRSLFKALDSCPQNVEPSSKAARSGIEAALLDGWCKINKQFLWQFLGTSPTPKACFYTAGLDEISKMVDGTKHALTMTPHLKIKLDSDVDKSVKILNALGDLYRAENLKAGSFHWSVDANSAWSWETAEKFVQVLQPFKDVIYMVEQPFDVDFIRKDEAHLDKWRQLKEAFGKQGMLVYADESFAGAQDVDRLRDFVHGVNVKLEKTGGIRAALKAIEAARAAGLKVWVGMMVGSLLLSSTPAHLMPLTDLGGDLDGAMWTMPESNLFDGGYTPRGDGLIHLDVVNDPRAYGNGVYWKSN